MYNHYKLATHKKDINRREIEFYQKIAPKLGQDLIIQCYDSAFNHERAHLLLEDLSATHLWVSG